MTARCDKCGGVFDSHEGGTVVDGVTYCPGCEVRYDLNDEGLTEEFTPDQMDALDEVARMDMVFDIYERGMDSTGIGDTIDD